VIPPVFTPEEIEASLRKEIKTLNDLRDAIALEKELYKSRSDHWREMCVWVYNRSREALLVKNRHERDAALCDINAKVGGAVR